MKKTTFSIIVLSSVLYTLFSCNVSSNKTKPGSVSGLDAENFPHYWTIEAENDSFRQHFKGDTLELIAPKGLTLWRNEKLQGDITISFHARIMDEGRAEDRLSDLNCFWMARDPKAPDIFKRMNERNGKFTNYYGLELYYMGYGGNYNTTTRFRRYEGKEESISQPQFRPAVIQEYTDSIHLLQANRWYHIELKCKGNHMRYFINGICLVDYTDPNPLREGWFGFRTTWSRSQITGFRYAKE